MKNKPPGEQFRVARDALVAPSITAARNWIDEVEEVFCELEISGGKRKCLAAITAHVALQNTDGLIALFETQRYTAGFALARPAYEAAVRAAWLWTAATDAEVLGYQHDHDPFRKRTFQERVSEIERHPIFSAGLLSKMKPNLASISQSDGRGGHESPPP
jgi:hypothetical protein